MKRLHTEGYMLVIFTNEAGIGKAKAKKENQIAQKLGRLNGFIRAVGVPMWAFCATKKDEYRKPMSKMWDLMCLLRFGGSTSAATGSLDIKGSFYVGDAAGRDHDHSDVDKRFAVNVGATFHTETDYFRGKNDGGTVYLEHDEGKYWSIVVVGSKTRVRWGKLGAGEEEGVVEKVHTDEQAAEKFKEKTLKEKLKRGYKEAEKRSKEFSQIAMGGHVR
jgi:DNA 3'-phosphatase